MAKLIQLNDKPLSQEDCIDTRVYLGSAELAAMCALAGRIVTVPEYMEQIKLVNAKAADVYRYMNFDQIPEFVEQAATVEM